MTWTDERVELLRKLWQDGHTASQIAKQLSLGVTRNAVIGKVHRLGLAARVTTSPNSSPKIEPKAQSRPAPSPPKSLTRSLRGNTALATAEQLAPLTDVLPQPREAVILPMCERVTIMELRDTMCRWPLGDPTAAEFRFCGAHSPVGAPYCQAHASLAYQPTQDRRRERERLDRERLMPRSG